jgi:predicted ATPase
MLREVRDSQEGGLARILAAVLSASSSRQPTTAGIDLEKAYECVQQFMKRQRATKALGTLEQFKKRYTRDSSLRQVVQDISRIEEDIAMAMAPRTKLQKIIQRLYTGKKHVSFTDETITVEDGEGNQIGLATLSSGEKHLMRILVEALLADVSTILIDEPELSMHVDWQSELVATLKALNSEAQFVLATHSPEVMACVPDKQVISL